MLSFFLILAISFVVSAIACFIHYEILHGLHKQLLKISKRSHHYKLSTILVGISIAHLLEIIVYAIALYGSSHFGLGGLEGAVGSIANFEDYLYFSVVSYSTLGIGEIYPVGHLRLLTGVEAVVGLMLIAWSATFFYAQMEKRWNGKQSS